MYTLFFVYLIKQKLILWQRSKQKIKQKLKTKILLNLFTAPKKEAVKIDPSKYYDFVVDKDTKHMKKGTYVVDGAMAQLLTDKKIGSVKS